MKRLALIVACLVAVGAGVALGAVKWRAYARDNRESRALAAIQQSADAGRWREAEDLSQQQHRALGAPTSALRAAAWRALDFRIAGERRDLPKLAGLAAVDPAVVRSHETGALWLMRTLDAAGLGVEAEAVRAAWKDREVAPVLWLCADADRLVRANRLEEARTLLLSRSFPDKDDVGRLLRLTLVSPQQPSDVAKYLDEAYRRDPTNPDLRTVRGQLLERSGQIEYARLEFIAALAADPTNPLQRDQLGSFYLRQSNLAQAAQVYAEKLGPEAPDFIWERASFLARLLARPGPDARLLPSERRAAVYGAWLAALPVDRFWDSKTFPVLNLPADFTLNRASAFWLTAIERLRTGDETGAAEQVAQATRAASAEASSLHSALRLAFAVRSGKSPAEPGISLAAALENEHQFYRKLRAAAADRASPADTREVTEVLRSSNGFSACFLAEGWIGPAVALADLEAAIAAPEWLQFGLIRALRDARGFDAALTFASRLPAQPATDYARAELMLSANREAEALALLDILARQSGEVSYSAGWLRATRLVELKRYDEALATVESCASLKPSIPAAELRARIALLRGDTAGAEKQFASLSNTSLEAGAYMARKAFAARNWKEARRLTAYWLEKFPDNLQLRLNLAAIDDEEKTP